MKEKKGCMKFFHCFRKIKVQVECQIEKAFLTLEKLQVMECFRHFKPRSLFMIHVTNKRDSA